MNELKQKEMKREIKFRVWEKYDSKMSYSDMELFDDMIGFRFNHFGIEVDGFDDIELMQFTGLKDKNGKEIYEGDVVRELREDWSFTDGWEKEDKRWEDESLFNPMPMKEVMRDVVTMTRFPGFWLEHESFGYEGEDLVSPESCEVIGNIYENPELNKE